MKALNISSNLTARTFNFCFNAIEYVFIIGHFTVVYGSETQGDLVLIQTLLLYYVNQVILMLTIIFQEEFP